jgi:hypothetical protein
MRDSTAGEPSRVFVGSKREAEEFFRESQKKLTALLLDLKVKFIATVRGFAERANRDRIGRLKAAIKAFKDDMEAELRSDILVDLEALTMSIRELAFHSIQKGLKIERIRCVNMIGTRQPTHVLGRIQIYSWGYLQDNRRGCGKTDLGFSG